MTTEINRTESLAYAGGGSLFGALLGGMLGSPVRRSELAETPQGPAGFDLGDDVDQVGVRIDAEEPAIVDQCECVGQSLAAEDGSGEEEIAPGYGEGPDSALAAPVVNLESSVLKTASEEWALVDRVGCRSPQRRFRKQLRIGAVNPVVEQLQNRERAPLAFFEALIGRKVSLFAVALDCVDVREVLQRNRGPPIFG